MRLVQVLLDGLPAHLELIAAPFDVVLADDTAVQPDLLIAPRDAFASANLPRAPLLAVEILSPSTRLIDMSLKKERYEAAGVASYWVVDPDEPRLRVWELHDGSYVEIADVGVGEEWTAALPYRVTIRPSALLE
jgi:Uma2 family endonuclease